MWVKETLTELIFFKITKRYRRRKKLWTPPEPPRNNAADRPSRVQRRHIYKHARRRNRDKKSELWDIDTAIYFYLRNLNDTERDFFAEVKTCLTKGSDYFTNGSSATSDHWLARCVFQNESCQTTLQTFIQLHYNNTRAPATWSRTISESGNVLVNLPQVSNIPAILRC